VANASRHLKKAFNAKIDIVEITDKFDPMYRHCKFNKIAQSFEELDEEKQYDLIFSSHWLQHMSSPVEMIRKIKRLLKPKGCIFIEVTNCEEPYWTYRHYPNAPHVQFFTK